MSFHVMKDITFFHANSSLINGLSSSCWVSIYYKYPPSIVFIYFINAGYKAHYGFSSNLIISLLELHSLLQSSFAMTLRSIQISGMSSRQLHILLKVTQCSLVSTWILLSYNRSDNTICCTCRCCPTIEGATLGYDI